MRLKTYLAEENITLKQFCEMIGCNYDYLCRAGSGKSHVGKRLAADVERATSGQVKLPTKETKSI